MSDPRVKTPVGLRDIIGTTEGVQYVTSRIKEVESQRNIAAAADYAAEDILSNSATDGQGKPWEFNDMGESGQILKAIVAIQTTALSPRITLYLFKSPPGGELDDNAANVAPRQADLGIYLGAIDFRALEDLGGVSSAIVSASTYGNLPLLYSGCSGKLYGIAVTRDAISGETANDLMTFKLTREIFA